MRIFKSATRISKSALLWLFFKSAMRLSKSGIRISKSATQRYFVNAELDYSLQYFKRRYSYCPCYMAFFALRQSAKLFSSCRNWDSPTPTPLAAGECAPHPLVPGGGHTRLRIRGWGSPNSDEWTYTVMLYIYKNFVMWAFESKGKSLVFTSFDDSYR